MQTTVPFNKTLYSLLTNSEVRHLLCARHSGQIGALPLDGVTLDSRPLSLIPWRHTQPAPTRTVTKHAGWSVVIRIDHVNWAIFQNDSRVTTLPRTKNRFLLEVNAVLYLRTFFCLFASTFVLLPSAFLIDSSRMMTMDVLLRTFFCQK